MVISSQVRAVALLDLPAVAIEAGIDPYPAMREAGIDPASLHRPDLTLSTDRVAWMLDGMAERAGIADLGIRIAMRRRLANLGVIGLVLGQQPTVRDALAMTQKYRHLMSDALSIHIDQDDDVATLIVGVSIGSSAPARQSRELALSTYIHLFRLLLGEHWSPVGVHFSHEAPKVATFHRRFFGCPVHFSSPFDGFECPSADLDRVNAQHQLISAGSGIGVLPCFIGDADPRLVPVLSSKRIVRTFWLVTHKDTHQLARIKAGRDWILQAVQANRSALLPTHSD